MVVMYHYVRDAAVTPFPAIRALPPALFEQQLDWLQQQYRVISLDQLESALAGDSSLPPNAALLTFDDGFVDHYATALPILRRRGLNGVFFLTHDACGPSPRVLGVHKTHVLLARLGTEAFTQAVLDECQLASSSPSVSASVFGNDRWEYADERAVKDLLNYRLPFADAERVLDVLFERHIGSQQQFARELYVNESMIREMSRAGMVVGYHTRSHRMLSRLTPTEQESELADGVGWIQALTGQARVPFCYPWGGRGTYTDETVSVLERYGYSVAFNTVRRRIDLARDDRFELPRLDTRDLPPYTSGEPEPVATLAVEEA
jgi:peptidoglycan/xylan/chitin deacetylase (PgdA/CDA1 family)